MNIFQEARLSRDPRFDGKFFIAVKTTGIFCRTICPAKLPLEKNVIYFKTREKAMISGYRPCLRCKPEFAPLYKELNPYSTTTEKVINYIQSGKMLFSSIIEISSAVYTSPRNLNRAFRNTIGVSVKEYQNINKALFVKKLIQNSNLHICDIVEACQYKSVSGLYYLINNYLKQNFKETMESKSNHELGYIIVKIPSSTFYDWDYFLEFQSKRLITGVENIKLGRYTRAITINGIYGWFSIAYANSVFAIHISNSFLACLHTVVNKIVQIFDLDINTEQIENKLRILYPELKVASGLHIPGVPSAYEAGIRAICGQQVSIAGATNLLNKFIDIFRIEDSKGNFYFPTAENITENKLIELKTTRSKKNTILEFSKWCCVNDINTDIDKLINVKGIGIWTINYIKLRAFKDPNIWMGSDLGIKKMIKRMPLCELDRAEPWMSYLNIHLWNNL